jgi:hypothetical protein
MIRIGLALATAVSRKVRPRNGKSLPAQCAAAGPSPGQRGGLRRPHVTEEFVDLHPQTLGLT